MYYLTGLDDLSDLGVATAADEHCGKLRQHLYDQCGNIRTQDQLKHCKKLEGRAMRACTAAFSGRPFRGKPLNPLHGLGYLGVADATQMPCSELQERYTNAIEWMQTRSKGHAAEAKARAGVLAAEAAKRCGAPLTPVLPTSAPGAQQPIQQSFLETAATQGGAAVGSIIQQLQAAGQIPGGPVWHEQPPQEEPAQIFGLNWKIVAGIGVAIGVGAFLLTRKKKA